MADENGVGERSLAVQTLEGVEGDAAPVSAGVVDDGVVDDTGVGGIGTDRAPAALDIDNLVLSDHIVGQERVAEGHVDAAAAGLGGVVMD
jgi:hypothetical protein